MKDSEASATHYLCGLKRDTCYKRLKDLLDWETLQESQTFINRVRDSQHNKVKYGWKTKFNRPLNKQGYMCNNGSFNGSFVGYMYRKSNGFSNTNNFMDTDTTTTIATTPTSSNTATINTTITVDNNIRAKWVVNLSYPLLSTGHPSGQRS